VAALADALVHIVGHCPAGPDLLLDALQLTINAARGWPTSGHAGSGSSSATADATAAGDGSGDLAAAAAEAADMQTVGTASRAWALVLQWLVHAVPRSGCQSALTRLSAMAAALVCWPPAGSAQTLPVESGASGRMGSSSPQLQGEASSSAASDAPLPQLVGTPAISPDPCGRFSTRCCSDDAKGGEDTALQGVCGPQGFLAGLQPMSQVCARGIPGNKGSRIAS
jgi:hypothetical protein